jgi:hypothetical protein
VGAAIPSSRFIQLTVLMALSVAAPSTCLGNEDPQESDTRAIRTSQSADGQLVTATRHGDVEDEPERFTCTLGPDQVQVTREGDVRWSGPGHRSVEVRVPLAKGAKQGLVRDLWCGLSDGDLLLLHHSTCFGPEGDFIQGGAVRVAATTGLVQWSARVQGNTGDALRSGKFLYVTGIGFVGKLDIQSGRYAWQHTKLYRSPGIYNSFDKPRRDGVRVIFPAFHANMGKPVPDAWPKGLVVHDESGKILEGMPPAKP